MKQRTTKTSSQAGRAAAPRPRVRLSKKTVELICEDKRRAQAKMHQRCQGDMKKLSQLCEETVAKLEREGGFKFKRGVPAGWTPPKINWAGLNKPGK
jgi:hypothetical protein